jgi:hypothetical protein
LLPPECDVLTSKLIQEATFSKFLSHAAPQAADLFRGKIAKRLVGIFEKTVKQTRPGHDGHDGA